MRDYLGGGVSSFGVGLNTLVSPNMYMTVLGSAGPTVVYGSAFPANTWLTIRMAVVADGKVVFQVNNGAETVVQAAMAGTFSAALHTPYAWCGANVGVGIKVLEIDEVLIMSGQLPSDKI